MIHSQSYSCTETKSYQNNDIQSIHPILYINALNTVAIQDMSYNCENKIDKPQQITKQPTITSPLPS